MKLKKFNKNNKRNTTLIIAVVLIVGLVVSTNLIRSHANFSAHKEFNVIQGKIPRAMKGDMVFAFLLDDEKSDKMPLKDTGYKYVDNAEACTNGATVSWDNEKWAPTVLNLTGPTVCNLKFSSIYESITVDGTVVKQFPDRGDYFINMGCSNVGSASFNEDTWRPSVTGINDNSKCNPVFKSKNSVVTKIIADGVDVTSTYKVGNVINYPKTYNGKTLTSGSISCSNGTGSWDNVAWTHKVSNVQNNTSCEVTLTSEYKESILNGATPVIKDGLVPVTIASDGTVKRASIGQAWYDYDNSEGKGITWANAVILSSGSFNVGDPIPEANIKGYFVWIPKYRYKLKSVNTNNTTPSAFDIEFNSNNTTNSSTECIAPNKSGEKGSCDVGKWMTHPAFTSLGENVTGIWVGKFETTGSTSALTVKPNQNSLRKITGKVMYDTAWNFNRNLDSHMMKNTEWGAMAYLTNSKYGRGNSEVWVNNYWNNTAFLTGCTGASVSAGQSSSCATPYFSNTGVKEGSTTRNMSGIFDTSGGSWEMVMGNYSNIAGSSGLTPTSINNKYIDRYTAENSSARILGDATQETHGWNGASAYFEDYTGWNYTSGPWFFRGGISNYTTGAGVFCFMRTNGGAHSYVSFRLALSPSN